MLAKLPIDKFAEGFVIECEALGVEPSALVKVAQIINTSIPGHSDRQGSGALESAIAQNPVAPGNLTKVNPLTAGVGAMANVGELGTNVQATGRAAQGGHTLDRINFNRRRRGLKELTPEQGQPMKRTTGREQFHRELGSYVPGAAMGQSIDKATQDFEQQTKGMRKYSPEWWGTAARTYGKGLVQGVVPTEKYKEHLDTGKKWWQRARGAFDPEYKKQLAQEQEEQALTEAEQALGEAEPDERRQQGLAERRFAMGQRRLDAKYKRDFREWNARRLAAAEAGQEFDEEEPEKPTIQLSPEKPKLRRSPLLWRSGARRQAGRF